MGNQLNPSHAECRYHTERRALQEGREVLDRCVHDARTRSVAHANIRVASRIRFVRIVYTTLRGVPFRKAARFSTAASKRRERASRVAQAMWGVTRQLRAESSGLWPAGGSTESTSSAAPARSPPFKASARSRSTM